MTYHIQFPETAESSIRVSNIDLKVSSNHEKTKSAVAEAGILPHRQEAYRNNLHTEQKRSLLFIFQATEEGGKDGLFILSVQ